MLKKIYQWTHRLYPNHQHHYRQPIPINLHYSQKSDISWLQINQNTTVNDYALIFQNNSLLVDSKKSTPIVPLAEAYRSLLTPQKQDYIYIGAQSQNAQPQKNLFAINVPNIPIESHSTLNPVPLRDTLHTVDSQTAHLICRSKHLLNWHSTSIFCGRCGGKNQTNPKEISKVCQYCNYRTYPTISPVIMVLVKHNNKILLARSPHFATGVYSTLAGFVDPGETPEAAVHREVYEEVGIKVKNLIYLGSQAWPFPGSLIFGFSAEYGSGELRLDPEEIEDAAWYDHKDLPNLPHEYSISRHMIEYYIELQKRG